jgi:dolichol-phosphate mannosyltransferase
MATYNERENVPALIQEILAMVPQADVLVVDDNSPDGTGKVADEMAAKEPRIHVIHRAGKLGLGTAILAAAHYAMEHPYDYFLNMDADFSHHPRYLPALIEGMKEHDVMIGSRYISGGGSENWPLSRQIMSRGVNLLVRMCFQLPARDTSGGYRCYRITKLRQTNLNDLVSRGYSFQQELLYRCRLAGCRIGETPIIFGNRRGGVSKVSPYEIVRSIAVIVRLGLRARLGLDRVKQHPPTHD